MTRRMASSAAPDGRGPLTNGSRISPRRIPALLSSRSPVPSPAVLIGNPTLRLGARRYDLTGRCLVMGILNRTPDSFYDQGATFAMDLTLRRAEALVAEGADVLDVGGVKAGPGPAVGAEEELDRAAPPDEPLVARL